MKRLFYISSLVLFYGCIFTYDPARGLLYLHNNSNKDVFVYLEYGIVDSLPLVGRLESFIVIDSNTRDTYTIGGNKKKPSFPKHENEITLFFIAGETMRSYNLDEVHKYQMILKKTTLTEEELKNKNWTVCYP